MRFFPKLSRLYLAATAALSASLLSVPALAGLGQPTDGNIGFQEPATEVMRDTIFFHDKIVFPIIVAIVAVVAILMLYIMIRFREKANPVPSKTTHNTKLEVVWTVIPVLILLFMAPFSMKLLYKQDTIPEAALQIKATANTWYWGYSYPDNGDIEFISNIIDFNTLEEKFINGEPMTHAQISERLADQLDNRPYLLATDNPLVVPVGTNVEMLVTSEGNYHAFSVPSFGVKIDAMPGRINSTWFNVEKPGRYYGQCSEICGIKHAFMPIEVVAIEPEAFEQWVANGGEFSAGMNQYLPSGSVSTAALELKK